MVNGAPQGLAAFVERARTGDKAAFAVLYQQRAGGVLRYAMSLLRNPAAAEDVAAQTFLQAWQGLPRLKHADRFDAWLFRIAHNVAMSELRRQPTAPLETAPEIAGPDRTHNPETLVAGRSDALAVRSALQALPEPMRDVLVLRFYLDLSHAEVGRQIGKSEQNARVLQFRALQQLKRILERSGVRSAAE